jgi:hypothetical protein
MRSVFLVALVGCSSPSAPPPPEGTHHAYTIDHLYVPTNNTQARIDALDLNGDGTADNELGMVTGTAEGMGIDFSKATEASIGAGMISLGVDLQTTAFDNADAVGFTTSATSGAPLDGTVDDGAFSLGPGPLSIAIAVFDPKLVVPLDLVDARVTLSGVDDAGIAQGVIAGGVTLANLRDDLYPALAVAFNDMIRRDCDASCNCKEYSAGRTIETYFDSPTVDCNVTVDEIAQNALIASLFAPDVTLDGQKLVSFGVGFSATRRD